MRTFLILTGFGQLGLALASLFLPRILRWREQTQRLDTLTRRVFWVYAVYILVTNLCLGALSAFAPDLLLARTPLARCVAAYAGAYWGGRIVIQVFVFHPVKPKGRFYAFVDALFLLLFVSWTACYGVIVLDRF